MGRIAAVFACLLLSGCAEYEARQRAEEQAAFDARERAEDGQCRSYGAEPGTPVYVQCRMNISNQRAQIQANDRAIIMQNYMRR